MKKILTMAISTLFVWASVASAEDREAPGVTTGEAAEMTQGLFDRAWTVTPRVGLFGFQDNLGNYASRMTEGFTTRYSLANLVGTPMGFDVGVESGLLYSHIGSPGSNVLGTNPPVRTTQGANTFIVPVNATVGYKFADRWIASMNVGASVLHRSVSNSMVLGRASDLNLGGSTDVFPNIGVNIGWALSKSLGLSLRGDLIPTPAKTMYTTTLGAVIGIS